MLLLIVFGAPLGRRSPTKPDSEARSTCLGDPPLADRIRRDLLFFSLVYYLAPNVDSATGSGSRPGGRRPLSWLVLSGLFAVYTSLSDSYEKTYGALASGIVLLLWLNYSAFAILFGAELNSELDRQADTPGGGPRAGLVQPGAQALR